MNILVTGGTGSLGHALVRQFLSVPGGKVGVFSRDEVKQAQMARLIPDPRMRFLLGDVRDLARLEDATYGYDAIVHAAALKRVDSVADSPDEVFKTNLDGTRNVLRAALVNKVPRMLFVSSDKACYPTNAYGVSKAAAEAEVTAWNRISAPRGVRCSVVRYGNVLGSRGSVVHAWRSQSIPEVTHPDMTRFVLTMPEACRLVSRALKDMEGGEIFVPELPAARILDLLEAVTGSRDHVVTGLRPGGEKMHETLLTKEESTRTIETGCGAWAIRPHLSQWQAGEVWAGAGPVKPGAFTSDDARLMSVRELREKLKDVPTEGV